MYILWLLLICSFCVCPRSASAQTILLDNFEAAGIREVNPGESDPQNKYLWNQYENDFSAGPDPGTETLSTAQSHDGTKSLLINVTGGNVYLQFYPATFQWNYMHAYIQPPTAWTQNTYNAMRFWVKVPSQIIPNTGGRENIQLGTYVNSGSDMGSAGQHYYHFYNLRYTGEWEQIIFDSHPTYLLGGGGGTELGDVAYPFGGSLNYMDALTRFYFDGQSGLSGYPAPFYFDGFELFTRPANENIDQVYSLHGGHIPAQNEVHVGWARRKDQDNLAYEVRYAFAPITTFASATLAPGGSIPAPGTGAYNLMSWSSTSINLTGQSTIYIAIKPAGATLFRQIAIPLAAVTAGPFTYWVAKTGSDSVTCEQAKSESTPKLTIGSGAACLAPGDTLIVKAGTYTQQLTNAIPGGTSWSQPVTVQANAGETVTVAPGAGGDGAVYFTNAASQYIILDGINLDGTGETNGHGLIVTGSAHHIRMQNAEVKNFYNQGILSSGATAGNNEFLNLRIHNNGTRTDTAANLDHGVYLETDSNLVERCEVYNHTGHGIHVYSANAPQPDNNFLHRNVVHDNTTIGIGLYGGSGNVARNNIIYDSTNAGIKATGTNANVTFNTIYSISEFGGYSESGSGHTWRNNIFADSGDWGLWLASGVTGLTVQNNLFWNNNDGEIDNDAGATLTGTLIANPVFVSAASRNLHIQAASPAREAAFTLPAITTDIDGETRPSGTLQDIGADEFVGGVGMRSIEGGVGVIGGGSFQ